MMSQNITKDQLLSSIEKKYMSVEIIKE